MAEMNPAQKQMKQLAENLKKTALGVSFARKLFTDPGSLSSKQILTAMQALGVQIPKEVVVTAEVAQIILTGQAIAGGIQAGKNLSDMKQLTNASAVGVRTVTAIAGANGWVDGDTASVINIGTDVFLLVASGGTDVSAWIGLALDLAIAVGSKQAQADIEALRNLQANYTGLMQPQARILGETFKDFQEKRISIYGVIAKMAVETPNLWPQIVTQDSPFVQMFPELMMVPVVGQTITGHGESSIRGDWPWPASGSYVIQRWTSNQSLEIYRAAVGNKETAAKYFFELLLKPWVTAYALANDEIASKGNMSMQNIAALSYIVNPDGEISASDDYVSFLLGCNLTPYDFGDNILEGIANEFVETAYSGRDTSFKEQAVSIGAVSKTFDQYNLDRDLMYNKIANVKQTDSIWDLATIPFIYKKLRSYMDFEKTSFEKDPSVGGKINEKFSEQRVTAWRKLHNYIAVLQMIDTFRTDSYLRNTRYAETLLPFMPSVDSFQKTVDHINKLSTVRSVNSLALNNLANILDVKPSQLTKTSGDNMGAATYEIKG